MSAIQNNTYYKDDMIIKETIVDGDIFEIVELYLDEEGQVVYEYKHDYTPHELQKIHNELLAGVHDRDYYGAPGMFNQIKAEERKRKLQKEKEEKLKLEKKKKNQEQYNKKIQKKLAKNKRRG